MIKFINNTTVNDFTNINDNDLYVCEEEGRILKGKLGGLADVINVPLLEVISGSTTNGVLKIPVQFNGAKREFIIQFGRVNVNVGDNVVDFNEPFPTTVYIPLLTPSRETEHLGAVKTSNNNSFLIKSNAQTQVFWLAIGR